MLSSSRMEGRRRSARMSKKKCQGGGRMSARWGKLFGAEVRYKRVQLGIESQQALAERLGYRDHGTLTQIEMGNVESNFGVAMELARYLQIDLNAILGIVPQRPRPPEGPP